ncbi:helix-turn-helix transcriptional regulator [Burkholderia sp. 9120]|uniref:helix-turn-helix domain-containing protein n=1 Tax=Burkholderia sp. 9120 TaxID=1500897 RepID=UPI00054F77E1|nr:helix-turn-helix transcriptional regulator [Burkholderia sp. 9120]
MEHVKMELLAQHILQRRDGRGIREAAKEVGISPATLSRVENRKIPDLETFGKICAWLGEDPAAFLGLVPATSSATRALVHFKKEVAIKPESAMALSEMIVLAQAALLKEEV